MDHIGIDVHKRESRIYVFAAGVRSSSSASAPSRSASPRCSAPGPAPGSWIEASTDSEWVARWLEALGHEGIVAEPNFAPMYATRSRKVKTDRRDTRALAEACLLGAYRPAHRLPDAQRRVRGRLLVRDAVVRTRSRSISLIRALLRQHGYRVPSGSAEGFARRVQGLPLPGRLLSVVAPLLALMRPLNRQLTYSDATIEHLAIADPRVPRLRSVPSVARSSEQPMDWCPPAARLRRAGGRGGGRHRAVHRRGQLLTASALRLRRPSRRPSSAIVLEDSSRFAREKLHG